FAYRFWTGAGRRSRGGICPAAAPGAAIAGGDRRMFGLLARSDAAGGCLAARGLGAATGGGLGGRAIGFGGGRAGPIGQRAAAGQTAGGLIVGALRSGRGLALGRGGRGFSPTCRSRGGYLPAAAGGG